MTAFHGHFIIIRLSYASLFMPAGWPGGRRQKVAIAIPEPLAVLQNTADKRMLSPKHLSCSPSSVLFYKVCNNHFSPRVLPLIHMEDKEALVIG